MKRNSRSPTWSTAAIACGVSLLISLAVSHLAGVQLWHNTGNEPAPATQNFGLAEFYEELAAPLAAAAPAFAITDADGNPVYQDNSRANVRLYEPMLAVQVDDEKPVGAHLPNINQGTGDCVSHAAANGTTYGSVCEAKAPGERFSRAFPPYLYWSSRTQINKSARWGGPGSAVAYAVQAMQRDDLGILLVSDPDCPQYSGSLADLWGDNKGNPARFKSVASRHRIRTAAPITSCAQARDALCNGYTVPFGHGPNPQNPRRERGWGTRSCRVVDGRNVANWDDSWAHAQCLIGYDGSAGPGHEYFLCLNSHGPTAHPAPLQGEPPGSYWITWTDMDVVFRRADAWAISGFEGFPARRPGVDWNFFGGAPERVLPRHNPSEFVKGLAL